MAKYPNTSEIRVISNTEEEYQIDIYTDALEKINIIRGIGTAFASVLSSVSLEEFAIRSWVKSHDRRSIVHLNCAVIKGTKTSENEEILPFGLLARLFPISSPQKTQLISGAELGGRGYYILHKSINTTYYTI
uniref:Uncharacterized protein n=1 Tax=Vespula pensylvanica TaxID=30213 RepID=A0A834JKZ3_VESPE|nr:hypothetical protein H0235_017588 [Vespula pensylvanica]